MCYLRRSGEQKACAIGFGCSHNALVAAEIASSWGGGVSWSA
jgi:hypothetical protein